MKKWKNYLPEAAVALLLILAFLPAIGNGFLDNWDDNRFILKSDRIGLSFENIRFLLTNVYCNLYTPLTFLSLMLDHTIFGMNAWGYHLHNILLFALSGAAACRILRKLGVEKYSSAAGILLWGWSVQRAESVVWISERKDMLCLFFAVLAFSAFLNEYEKKRIAWISPLLFFLSMAAKPAAWGVPAAMAVYAVSVSGFSLRKWNWRVLLPVFFATVLYSGISSLVSLSGTSDGIVVHPLKYLIPILGHNTVFYLSTALFASEANPVYPLVTGGPPWPWRMFLLTGCVMLIAVRLAWKTWKNFFLTLFGFGLIWCACHGLSYGFFIFNPTDYADRYNLMPSLTVVFLLLLSLQRIGERFFPGPRFFRLSAAVLGVCAGILLCFLEAYLPVWRSDSLFRYAVLSPPEGYFPPDRVYTAHGNYGITSKRPELCREASDWLFKKVLSGYSHPTDNLHSAEARCIHACLFGQAAAILRNDPADQLRYYRLLRGIPDFQWHEFNEKFARLNQSMINFYFLLKAVSPGEVPEFLDWQDRRVRENGIPNDPFLSAMLALERKRNAEALALLRAYRNSYPAGYGIDSLIAELEKTAGSSGRPGQTPRPE